ncbi:MAG: transglutaminase domain-containing protein [Bacteroidales bacterium]|jgi:hypothetical protein|nr:transglutaminase domain-containing protein [Bacteroidales bacterium]
MKVKLILVCIITLVFVSCNKTKNSDIQSFETDYQNKKTVFSNYLSNFFNKVESENLLTDEKKYLKFLFAYMPLSDFAEYDFDFYVKETKLAIQAKNTFVWAKSVPEDIFMNYVLPPRINNENTDSARLVLFDELKMKFADKNFSMAEAALEINHWCHEKMNYQGTDERTIAPLGAIKRAFGRCGEESTFFTTALRTVGIPARQVYTPRWAHTDDNHAWVEVWIDGTWHYLGACEPLPIIDRGWFDVPATRTMLVYAKEFGTSKNISSDFLFSNNCYSAINSISNYAPIKNLEILVVDSVDVPLSNVSVQFQLYNYAELFPLFSTKTDENGKAFFKTGLGSLEIFVNNETNFVSKIINKLDAGLIKISLTNENILPAEISYYEVPIVGKAKITNPELEKINNKRLETEDSIRENYIATFYSKEKAEIFRNNYKYSDETIDFLIDSRGNYSEIEKFLIYAADKNLQKEALQLLKVISTKDLVDTYSDILIENLEFALQYKNTELPEDIFQDYVLNPRITFEVLKNYRKKIITDFFKDENLDNYKNNPQEIANFVLKNIQTKIDTIEIKDFNSFNVIISPAGVCKLRLADNYSLKIFYVAVCRTLGIPAQIESATGFVRFYQNGKWKEIFLETPNNQQEIKRTSLKLKSGIKNRELKYRINFSLAHLKNNQFETVDLGWENQISEFENGIDLQVGTYMLLSSIRKENGDVIVKREYFNLLENQDTLIIVTLPEMIDVKNISSKIIPSFVFKINSKEKISFDNFKNNKGFTALCWLNPAGEPSKHIINDISPMIEELKKNNINVNFLVNEANFNPEKYKYPSSLNYFYDKDIIFLKKNMGSGESSCEIFDYPVIMLVDSENNIIYKHSGYIIGIGDVLLNR